MKQNRWSVGGVEEVSCSLVKIKPVQLSFTTIQKVAILMSLVKTEWIAYLQGKLEEDVIQVKDLVVPPHKEVSACSAEVEPFHIPTDCVGVIHSHRTMGTFHSLTDADYVDRTHPVSMVVSIQRGKIQFSAVSWVKTPCGKHSLVTLPVQEQSPEPTFNVVAFAEEALTNIKQGEKKNNLLNIIEV